MPLTDKQLQHVCLLGAGASQCRYVIQDPSNWRWHNCIKQVKGLKKRADASTRKYIEDCKKQRIDPKTGWTAIGDNCQGYPYLPRIKQGFDIPKP